MGAGLAIRFAHLGLPFTVTKYGGSMLWALMIYWIVSTLLPRWRPSVAGFAAGILATAIEIFKLYRSPAMDAFRLTLPGALLLGRIFSIEDIAAYWVVICGGVLLDRVFRHTLAVQS